MSYTPGPLPEPQKQVYCSHPDNIGNTWTAWRPAADDYFTAEQLSAHTAAEVARAVAAERERCAKLSIRIGNKKDSECPSACNGFWPDQVGFAIATAIRADPQRLQGTGE